MLPLSHLTSCTPTKSNLYIANSLAATVETCPTQAPNIPNTEFHIPFPMLRSYQRNSPGLRHQFMFQNMILF